MIQQEAKQRENQKDAEEYIHKNCHAFPRFYYQYMWKKGKVFLKSVYQRAYLYGEVFAVFLWCIIFCRCNTEMEQENGKAAILGVFSHCEVSKNMR